MLAGVTRATNTMPDQRSADQELRSPQRRTTTTPATIEPAAVNSDATPNAPPTEFANEELLLRVPTAPLRSSHATRPAEPRIAAQTPIRPARDRP